MPVFHSLRCPVCQIPLLEEEGAWRCENKHSFDVAKEGYLNLLLVNKKKTADPGDSREMLQNRREFLGSGVYSFLPKALTELAKTHVAMAEGVKGQALDLGCGEGFYTDYMKREEGNLFRWSGLDISRDGIRLAAKKYRDIPFTVGSNFDLPYETASQDLVMQIFAPSSSEEVRRVLKPGGVYLLVTPGEKHLMGLKEKLYDEPKKHDVSAQKQEGLELIDEQGFDTDMVLDSQAALQNLFKMTPFYWKAGEARRAELAAIESLATPLSFHVAVYRREANPTAAAIWGAK